MQLQSRYFLNIPSTYNNLSSNIQLFPHCVGDVECDIGLVYIAFSVKL